MTPARALLGTGVVRHLRLRPARHGFEYPTYFLLLPLRALRRTPDPALPRNRFGLVSFHDRDHGDGSGDCLAWIDDLLAREGIEDADGEVWLHCYPRVLGYVFKPVSFWYCHRADGSLRAIVAEVNNTFGERHAYLLDRPRYGQELQARKVFHVSPFCTVDGGYRFEFRRGGAEGLQSARVRIDYHDAEGPVLLTGMAGRLEPLNAASRHRALWRYPLLTLGVMARILWNALLLWLKQVPFYTKPQVPASPVSRSSSSNH